MSSSQPLVTIVGGGLVGGVLACALTHQHIPIRIVDPSPLKAFLEDYGTDWRAIAVSPSSKNLLERVDIWEMCRQEAQPIGEIKTVHGQTGSTVSFQENQDPLGYIIPMFLLKKAVASRVHSQKQKGYIQWIEGTLKCLEDTSEGVALTLDTGETFNADLLVGADGKHSKVRTLSDMPWNAWEYGKKAVVCTYAHTNDHQSIAWEIFLEEGPFAILPMTGQRSGIVWSVQEDSAESLKAMPDEAFDALILEKMSGFEGVKRIGPRWVYPIGVQFAETYIAPHRVLVGDAAHVMHPLAGQGLNMGLRDVAALMEVLGEQFSLGLPLSHQMALEKYQRWRRFDNLSMVTMTDAFDGVFSNGSKIMGFLREKGLRLVSQTGGLKKLLNDNATGMLGNVPTVLRNAKNHRRTS